MTDTDITNNVAFLRIVTMVVSASAIDTRDQDRFEALLSLHEEIERRVRYHAYYCRLQ